jgi:uncharacterized membrane protein YccC
MIGDWLGRHRGELRLALRVTVAALAAFAFSELIALPQSYQAVLTTVIVLQASLGGSLKSSLDRLVGAVGGGLWGGLVALSMPDPDLAARFGALALGVAPLALVAAFNPAYRVAPITAIIVLLSPFSSESGPLAAAAERVLAIAIGCAAAFVAALLLWPARAHSLLAERAQDALALMGELTERYAAALSDALDIAAAQALHRQINAALAQLAAIGQEAVQERHSFLTAAPDVEPLLRTLRRLHHDLSLLGAALAEPPPEIVAGRLRAPTAAALAALAAALRDGGAALAAHIAPPPLDDVAAAVAGHEAAMAELRREGTLRGLDGEAVGRVFALAFVLEQMHGNLADLAARTGELASAPGRRS